MAPHPDRRTRKRLATRQTISDVATQLFIERGFDRVTVDDIAHAADVGRMTVFNHFPRKEDMFFDRDQEARELLLDAVRTRAPGVAPLEALHGLAHRLVGEGSPAIRFFEGSRRFVEAVAGSEALMARARAIRDEAAGGLAEALATSIGRPPDDADARLAAGLLLAAWTVAFLEAHEAFRRDGNRAGAEAVFLAVVDKGARGLAAALAGTPYVEPA